MTEQEDAGHQHQSLGDQSTPFAELAAQSRRIITDWLARNGYPMPPGAIADPLDITTTFLELTARMVASPNTMAEAQVSLWHDYLDLWQNTTARMLGLPPEPVDSEKSTDERFVDPAWEESNIFNFVKQSYLLTSRWLMSTVHNVGGLNPVAHQKADLYTRQFVNALSPTNFALTNPEVIRATIETGGENLIHGLTNLLNDLDWGAAALGLSHRSEAFEVGKSLAATRGKVIYRNDMMELIQYEPTTETVEKRPILFVPAWINKYYVFDLREETSWVRWAVGQGHTVFMISWVDPDAALAAKSCDDYVLLGPVAALDAIEQATGEREVNAVGYCIGGTLLATAIAYLAKIGDQRIKSVTLLATLLDFSEPGELGLSIDEAMIAHMEEQASERGYADDQEISILFNSMREHDLIWSFVVNTYLLGKDRFPFDYLYWNWDSTRMPSAMHSYYLRNFYQANKLVEAGGITIAGVPIDLADITIPAYLLSMREDHISPWKSAYAGVRLLHGPTRFTLSSSGHVTGLIAPPQSNRYRSWINSKAPTNPEEWLAAATVQTGSWWSHWHTWCTAVSPPGSVPARVPGAGSLKPLCDAPGTYLISPA